MGIYFVDIQSIRETIASETGLSVLWSIPVIPDTEHPDTSNGDVVNSIGFAGFSSIVVVVLSREGLLFEELLLELAGKLFSFELVDGVRHAIHWFLVRCIGRLTRFCYWTRMFPLMVRC